MPSDHPISTARYTLTRRDALAFEQGRPLGALGRTFLVVWLALAPLETALIAGEWDTDWRVWAPLGAILLAAHFAIAKLAIWILACYRASRRVPADVHVELEDWGNHMVVRTDGREAIVRFEAVAATALTTNHLFISAPPDTLIVPTDALDGGASAAALQSRIEAFGRND